MAHEKDEIKFNRAVLEFTHAEKQNGRISFYASLVNSKDQGHLRVFSLRFSPKDESLYLIPQGSCNNLIKGVGENSHFECHMGEGDCHISFHASGVVNVTLGKNRYRLREAISDDYANKPILSFAVKASATEIVNDDDLCKKGKPIFMGGGIGAGLASCVGIFAEPSSNAIEERFNRPFVIPRPPILQVFDYALRIKDRNVTYWISTWSAPPEFEEDWIVAAGSLPGNMMKYPKS